MKTEPLKSLPLTEREHEVIAALRKIRYGGLEITLHNSEIVQIERKEKTRFADKPAPVQNE